MGSFTGNFDMMVIDIVQIESVVTTSLDFLLIWVLSSSLVSKFSSTSIIKDENSTLSLRTMTEMLLILRLIACLGEKSLMHRCV